jgi:hypothetical protein
MRIEDHLYFAPGIRFDDVDVHGTGLPEQFRARIQGFYLQPAYDCAQRGQAFAAGALVLVCVDALARILSGDELVGRRFKRFARNNLPSFASGNLAGRLYNDFRNGLIHEGRMKSGAQFSLEVQETLVCVNQIMIINPVRLAAEVGGALDRFVEFLLRDAGARRRLSAVLIRDHDADLGTNDAEG